MQELILLSYAAPDHPQAAGQTPLVLKIPRMGPFFSEQRVRSKIFWQMAQCLVNICVVVYNVVVFCGEDIGGQMREMAIFGVPC